MLELAMSSCTSHRLLTKVMAVDSEILATVLVAACVSSEVMASDSSTTRNLLIVDSLDKNGRQQSSLLQLRYFLIRPTWRTRTILIVSSGCLSGLPFVFVVSVV